MRFAVLVALLAFAPLTHAATVVNPSFEDGTLNGWTLTGGGVDVFSMPGADGTYVVDLNRVGTPSMISQSVGGLAVGSEYELRFLLYQNNNWCGTSCVLRVTIDNAASDVIRDFGPLTLGGWTETVIPFTAASATVTLMFNDISMGPYAGGPLIDNVRLSESGGSIPEPATLLLSGAGLIVCAWLRRRRS